MKGWLTHLKSYNSSEPSEDSEDAYPFSIFCVLESLESKSEEPLILFGFVPLANVSSCGRSVCECAK